MNTRTYALTLLLLCASSAAAQSEGPFLVQGLYENFAEGYAVTVPDNLVGVAGNEGGPQRGFSVLLPSRGAITVWGEPNSLEYPSPEEGVRQSLSLDQSTCKKVVKVKSAKLGPLQAAEGAFTCGDRVVTELLAFRPGGGPIYFLRLDSLEPYFSEDAGLFRQFATSFSII